MHDAFEELRDQANAWLARFAPLVMSPSAGLTESEVRKRLESVERLKSEAGSLRPRLGSLRLEDADLANTVEQALRQLDSVEEELRRTLGKLVPGDPAGLVDLDAEAANIMFTIQLTEAVSFEQREDGGFDAVHRKDPPMADTGRASLLHRIYVNDELVAECGVHPVTG